MFIQIINGNDLPQKEAKSIEQLWINTFRDGKKISENKNITFNNEELFFIARNESNVMLSVGCLKSVKMKFSNKNYLIKGIGGIVSIVQGSGYGKLLMQEIRKYLKKENLMGIGFCLRKNTLFYEKCNFFVEKDLINKFIYKDASGNSHLNPDEDDDVIYFNDKYSLIQNIVSSPKAKIFIPFWW